MIYNDEYKVKFYKNRRTGVNPVYVYISSLNLKHRSKIYKYIEFLRSNQGYINEPYSRHITGKIRELRIDFSNNRYRILYFLFIDKKIILLHAFLKKTTKTPIKEINIAVNRYNEFINNYKLYE